MSHLKEIIYLEKRTKYHFWPLRVLFHTHSSSTTFYAKALGALPVEKVANLWKQKSGTDQEMLDIKIEGQKNSFQLISDLQYKFRGPKKRSPGNRIQSKTMSWNPGFYRIPGHSLSSKSYNLALPIIDGWSPYTTCV